MQPRLGRRYTVIYRNSFRYNIIAFRSQPSPRDTTHSLQLLRATTTLQRKPPINSTKSIPRSNLYLTFPPNMPSSKPVPSCTPSTWRLPKAMASTFQWKPCPKVMGNAFQLKYRLQKLCTRILALLRLKSLALFFFELLVIVFHLHL